MRDTTGDLWRLTACELSAAYAEGLTPTDVLDATLARIAEVNPKLNAIVTLDEAGARRAAEASTRRWAEGASLSALDGVTFTVKDNIFVGGLRATWGSALFAEHIAIADETPVAKIRAAGAVIIGKTNVPEFTVHGYTDNALFGTTRNPWDVALTPGGSSGGAAAAVASGMGALALGTDGGGSIRRPAAHTGLVGFKPSRNMVPRGQGFPAILHDLEVIGPLARCIDDVVLVMDTIGGPLWREPAYERPTPRIAFAPTFNNAPVDRSIRMIIEETIAQAIASGLQIDRIESFDLASPLDQIWPVISQTGIAWLLASHREDRHLVSSAIASMAEAGNSYSGCDYLDALDKIAALNESFDAFFERYDFLVTPTTAAMPWPADQPHPSSIDDKPVGPRGHAIFTPVANVLGLPAISIPCSVTHLSMPVGLQIIAPLHCDLQLLKLSKKLSPTHAHRWAEATDTRQ